MASSAHFTDSELACRHCGSNQCQQKLVDALEALRVVVGLPITVDDAYRCPTHNAAVGGAIHSEHMQGIAADIKITGFTVIQMYVAALKVPAFRGIGVARHQGYIHVDARAAVARWCYDKQGKVCEWDTLIDAEAQV